jgi:hypothetical protein
LLLKSSFITDPQGSNTSYFNPSIITQAWFIY